VWFGRFDDVGGKVEGEVKGRWVVVKEHPMVNASTSNARRRRNEKSLKVNRHDYASAIDQVLLSKIKDSAS
jgi:hypothetical protein